MRRTPGELARVAAVREVLHRYRTRLFLSLLILLSVSPFGFVDRVWFLFFALFLVEAGARTYVLLRQPRADGGPRLVLLDAVMLVFDLVALFSFLPLAEATGLRFLRLARFFRLGLLMRYWGGTFRSLWHLLRREERARQIRMLLVSGVGLTFVSAALLHEVARGVEPSELGLESPPTFTDLLWWSVRQLADPGALVSDVDHLGLVLVSVVMTLSGVILFSFLVGIGTSAVSDLMAATRDQPMGYRDHSVLLGAGDHATFLLDEVVDHLDKHLRPPHWMVLGAEPNHHLEAEPRYRRIHYRRGSSYHAEDLEKVDAATADTVVVMADPTLEEPDSDTMSALLSVRQINPGAHVIAEVIEEKHATAILAAGGDQTVVVATQHLLAVVLANLVARPEYEHMVEELLTVRGTELYSYIYPETGAGAMAGPQDWPDQPVYGAFLEWAWRQHGSVPIGLASSAANRVLARQRDYGFVLDPGRGATLARGTIRGVVGLSRTLDDLSGLARSDALARGDWGGLESVPPSLPPCRLADARAPAENILVCRFTARTPMLIEHLLRFQPGSTIWLMMAGDTTLRRAQRELSISGASLLRFGDPERYDAGPRGQFERQDDGSFAYRAPDGAPVPGCVRLLRGDWTSRSDLLGTHDHGFDVFGLDQVVIQTDPRRSGDPDARAVMALLKLTDLMRHVELGPRFRPHLELVVEIVDPLKARLLERRFEGAPGETRLPVSVVTTEWLRHVLMFQATMVPGFSELFYALFSHQHAALRRLVLEVGPEDASRAVDFGELLRHVYEQTGMTLLGLEHRGRPEVASRVLLAPEPAHPDARMTLGQVSALYALGPTGV